MMDGVGSVEEVFFSKVSGKIILEIFEKSIDKHKIDAILNAPSFAGGPIWTVWRADVWPEDSTEESGCYHPDTRIPMKNGRELLCAHVHGRERLKDIASCIAGCSLKSVE